MAEMSVALMVDKRVVLMVAKKGAEKDGRKADQMVVTKVELTVELMGCMRADQLVGKLVALKVSKRVFPMVAEMVGMSDHWKVH